MTAAGTVKGQRPPKKDRTGIQTHDRRICRYATAAVNLYGVADLMILQRLLECYEGMSAGRRQIWEALWSDRFLQNFICFRGDRLILSALEISGARFMIERMQQGRPYYLPPPQEISAWFEPYYIQRPPALEILERYLSGCGITAGEAASVAAQVLEAASVGHRTGFLMRLVLAAGSGLLYEKEKTDYLLVLVEQVRRHTRMVPLRGFTVYETELAPPCLWSAGDRQIKPS